MEALKFALVHYLIGLLLILLDLLYKNYIAKSIIELKVKDVIGYFVASLLGPLLLLVPVGKGLVNFIEWIDDNHDRVVWQNRRANNKKILFGRVDDEEE